MRQAWRWWVPPAIVALALALLYLDPFIGDWDALDYTVLAFRGQPSSMALGRMLFIFANHGSYVLAHALCGLAPEKAYLLFKYTVVAESPLAVIGCWALAYQVSHSVRAATIAALFMVTSPIFVLYSGQFMTEVPSLLLLTLALLVHLRGLESARGWMVMAGAVMLGAAVNVRETVAFYAPWLVLAPFVCGWKLRRRELICVAGSVLVFLCAAIGPWAWWMATDSSYDNAWRGWRETMLAESARHPVTVYNLLPLLAYLFLTAPMVAVALPAAIRGEWTRRGLTPLLLLAGVGLFADLLLVFNYSTTINIRYFLIGLPALAPLAADYFYRSQTSRVGSERRAFLHVVASLAFIALVMGFYTQMLGQGFRQRLASAKDYRTRLAQVPRDGVMIAGAQTVGVTYWRGLGEGEWGAIGTGSGWPGGRLGPVIESYLSQGRRVFLDSDPRWWFPCGWQQAETVELTAIESHFRFRRVSDDLYEIRPLSDLTASDVPDLKRLLPENRPVETRRCGNIRRLT